MILPILKKIMYWNPTIGLWSGHMKPEEIEQYRARFNMASDIVLLFLTIVYYLGFIFPTYFTALLFNTDDCKTIASRTSELVRSSQVESPYGLRTYLFFVFWFFGFFSIFPIFLHFLFFLISFEKKIKKKIIGFKQNWQMEYTRRFCIWR